MRNHTPRAMIFHRTTESRDWESRPSEAKVILRKPSEFITRTTESRDWESNPGSAGCSRLPYRLAIPAISSSNKDFF